MIIKQINDRLAVKWLDNSYVDKCMEIRKNNKTDVGGAAFSSTDYAHHLFNNQYMPIKPSWACRAYGVVDIETDELHSFFLFKMLTSHRAWLIRLVISNQNISNGLPMNGLGYVHDEILKYAEEKEYYQYFMVVPVDRVAAHDRIWTKQQISSFRGDRYVTVLEEIVPANCIPGYTLYWDECMGRATLPFDAAIRRAVLLPEHRTFKDAKVLD